MDKGPKQCLLKVKVSLPDEESPWETSAVLSQACSYSAGTRLVLIGGKGLPLSRLEQNFRSLARIEVRTIEIEMEVRLKFSLFFSLLLSPVSRLSRSITKMHPASWSCWVVAPYWDRAHSGSRARLQPFFWCRIFLMHTYGFCLFLHHRKVPFGKFQLIRPDFRIDAPFFFFFPTSGERVLQC